MRPSLSGWVEAPEVAPDAPSTATRFNEAQPLGLGGGFWASRRTAAIFSEASMRPSLSGWVEGAHPRADQMRAVGASMRPSLSGWVEGADSIAPALSPDPSLQ